MSPLINRKRKLRTLAETYSADGTIRNASELLSTAATLGMPIPAPVGATVHIPALHNPMRISGSPWVHVVEGCFSTEDGAIRALADYLIEERHQPNRVGSAPWSVPGFWKSIAPAEWQAQKAKLKQREREVHNRARDRWTASRTPREIVEALAGAEGATWQIQAIRISK